jgi:hypothetical protein
MPIACPDPVGVSAWRAVMAMQTGALPFAALLALITLSRARLMGAIALLTTAASTALAVATGAASAFLFLRFGDTIARIAAYFPRYPSSCISADEVYGHFSPPPGFFDALQRSTAQIVPLDTAAAIDSVVAVSAIIVVLVCALVWGRRRPPAPVT